MMGLCFCGKRAVIRLGERGFCGPHFWKGNKRLLRELKIKARGEGICQDLTGDSPRASTETNCE